MCFCQGIKPYFVHCILVLIESLDALSHACDLKFMAVQFNYFLLSAELPPKHLLEKLAQELRHRLVLN